MEEEPKTKRKMNKKQKMMHKREIVLSLSIIAMLFLFLAFMMVSKFFVVWKNASGYGYLADFRTDTTKYDNGKFTVNLMPEKISEFTVKVSGPVEKFPITMYGTGDDVSLQVGESSPLIAYGSFEGNNVDMQLFPDKKQIVFNDSISLVFPRASIYSASIMLDDDLGAATPINWDVVSLNGYAVIPGLNNIKNKIDLVCRTDLCHSTLAINSDEPGSIMISSLDVRYTIERMDYSYEVDTFCKSYPCEVPIKLSSSSKGTITLDIPYVLKVGEDTPVTEQPTSIEGSQSSENSIVHKDSLLLQIFMIIILVGFMITVFVSQLNSEHE